MPLGHGLARMVLIIARMLSGESIETWLRGHTTDMRKRIPRRRQGHNCNMLYICMEICGPNQFSWILEKHRGWNAFKNLSSAAVSPVVRRRRPSAVEERRAEVGIRDVHYVRRLGQMATDQDSAKKQHRTRAYTWVSDI